MEREDYDDDCVWILNEQNDIQWKQEEKIEIEIKIRGDILCSMKITLTDA